MRDGKVTRVTQFQSKADALIHFYAHFKLRDDKVVYIFDHGDRAAAIEAVGLSE